jgi:hypothetical protein
VFAGGVAPASAQVTTTEVRPLSVAAPVPTETRTLLPREGLGSIAGKNVGLSFKNIELEAPSLAARLSMWSQSKAIVYSPLGATNGVYSVRFVFTYVNGASTIAISRNGTVIAQCNLHNEYPVKEEQVCDSGFFDVTDGNYSIEMAIPTGIADLKSATVTYGPLTTIRSR